MTTSILIERVSNLGFRATSGSPFEIEVEAPTRDEAITKIRVMLQQRLRQGAELVDLELSPPEHPLAPFAGMLQNDPLLNEWKAAMAENRERLEAATVMESDGTLVTRNQRDIRSVDAP